MKFNKEQQKQVEPNSESSRHRNSKVKKFDLDRKSVSKTYHNAAESKSVSLRDIRRRSNGPINLSAAASEEDLRLMAQSIESRIAANVLRLKDMNKPLTYIMGIIEKAYLSDSEGLQDQERNG